MNNITPKEKETNCQLSIVNCQLFTAVEAALKAGREILTIYDDPKADFQVERKADNSPLTIADRRSNEVIMQTLDDTPYPVLSEEGRNIPYEERRTWHTLWIVDPLDGTKEFIKRNGEFTVNIALVTDGVPVAGVIYVPVRRELYFADMENGAYKMPDIASLEGIRDLDTLRSRSLRLPYSERHPRYVVVASSSHATPETTAFIDTLRHGHPDLELVSIGSSLKLCLVAEGKADIYPRFAPTMEWDTAAGHAIVRAAGGEVWQTGNPTPVCYNKEDLLNPWFIVSREKPAGPHTQIQP